MPDGRAGVAVLVATARVGAGQATAGGWTQPFAAVNRVLNVSTLLAGGATVPDAEMLAEQIVVEIDRGRADRDAEFALFMVEATPALRNLSR